jgi:NAD(P)-dependent dehydrogenase (short-subunit alcohol dehydrogenase family)
MLINKIIVVTGGSGLLGKSIIKTLKKNNAIVINADLNCFKNLESGEYTCDITNEESVNSLIKSVIQKYGKIDGWINNAYPRTADWHLKIEDIPYESWRKNVDMHLNGYFLCSQKILEQMKVQREGVLINMASIYGLVGPDFSIYEGAENMTMPAAYSAIKGGIISLTRYLASYFGPYNIRVNCISPGGIFDDQNENFVKNYESKVPLKRMGKTQEIADSVLFLFSPLSSYVNGHNLIIDGGWSII